MRALVQRVSEASVAVEGRCVSQISRGLVALIGIARDDDASAGRRLLEKICGYRLFPDAQGRMNRSLDDIAGGLLLVPNFTLMADTRRGLRPSFTPAAPPAEAAELFKALVAAAGERVGACGAGVFGADMQLQLVNDGPVTVILEVSGRG